MKQSRRGIAISADGTLTAAVYNSNLRRSSDSGRTWTELTQSGSKDWQCVACSSDGRKLAATVNSGNIWLSSDSGQSWAEVKPTPEGKQWRAIAMSSDGTKLAAAIKGGNVWTS